MPGFKRRQARLVSHYKWNDFSCHPISSRTALGRVSKVNIHNYSVLIHYFLLRETQEDYFLSRLAFHLRNEEIVPLGFWICLSPFNLIIYTQLSEKKNHREEKSKFKLMFLPCFQNVEL